MTSAANIERLLELESGAPRLHPSMLRPREGLAEGLRFPKTCPAAMYPAWQERERYMAAEITSALERLSPARPVYIGGWWHLSREGSIKTLRELLGIGAESCRLLDRGEIVVSG